MQNNDKSNRNIKTMKTPEDLIIEKVGEYWWICGKHRPEFIAAAIEFGNQMYNQAIEDAAQNAEIKWNSDNPNRIHTEGVDKQSILKLKKSVSSTD